MFTVKQLAQKCGVSVHTCTPEILLSLGQMYAGGEGTGAFAREAIERYCGK